MQLSNYCTPLQTDNNDIKMQPETTQQNSTKTKCSQNLRNKTKTQLRKLA